LLQSLVFGDLCGICSLKIEDAPTPTSLCPSVRVHPGTKEFYENSPVLIMGIAEINVTRIATVNVTRIAAVNVTRISQLMLRELHVTRIGQFS
jgi:hypothetical protein